MEKGVKIVLSGLYGYYPSGSFTETFYLPNARAVRTGDYFEEFRTDAKYKNVITGHHDNQLIQAIQYDAYKIEWLKTESINTELLKVANTITVTDTATGKTLNARLTACNTELVSRSTHKVTFEFYDRNTENYPNGYPVHNKLRSDVIKYEYSQTNLVQVKINIPVSASYSFFSLLEMVELEKEPENLKEFELNGYIKTARVTTKTQKRVILFLKNSDLQLLRENAPLCTESGNMTLFFDGTTYNVLERPELEVSEIGGIELNKVVLKATTTVNNTAKYS